MELIGPATFVGILNASFSDAATARCNCYREHEHEIIVSATDRDHRGMNIQQRKRCRGFRVMNRLAAS
jgi:hypothetical protein